jgi:hypothetical protein
MLGNLKATLPKLVKDSTSQDWRKAHAHHQQWTDEKHGLERTPEEASSRHSASPTLITLAFPRPPFFSLQNRKT